MNLVGFVSEVISRRWTNKNMLEASERIKAEANLPIYDWVPYIENRMLYPLEVQTVQEAPNEEHIRLYNEDIKAITDLKAKSLELIYNEIPNYCPVRYLDGTIRLYLKEIWYSNVAFDRETREMIRGEVKLDDLPNRLYLASQFLYDNVDGLDFAMFVQGAYSQYETLLEESNKNLKIIEKGISGEDYVSDILQQYREKFFYLENIVIPAYEEQGNTSETDVYIISSQGVFVCEVKNYGADGQRIVMPQNGDWKIYEGDRFLKEKPSAFVQNARHCRATAAFLRKYLGEEVPIIPVVIIANDDVEIENYTENDAIRAAKIYAFIQSFPDAISSETQQRIVDAFEANKLDAKDFPVKLNRDRAAYVSGAIEEFIPYLQANEKIADEITRQYKQNQMISKVAVLALAAIWMIPAIQSGAFGIIYTLMLFASVSFTRSTVATVSGCIALICLMVVHLTASPFVIGISFVGALISFWLTGKEIK